MIEDRKKLTNYAFNLLARRSYSIRDIQKKMNNYINRRNMEEELVEQVIAKLIEHRYLDDEKYASNYVESRIRLKPRGIFLIKKELKMKGISEQLVERTISRMDISEEDMAGSLLDKKLPVWNRLEPKKRRERAYRYLTSRGFKMETVYKAVNRCYDPRA
jgi:regulatory protein